MTVNETGGSAYAVGQFDMKQTNSFLPGTPELQSCDSVKVIGMQSYPLIDAWEVWQHAARLSHRTIYDRIRVIRSSGVLKNDKKPRPHE